MRVEEELYNISSDPECMINLVPDPGYNVLKQECVQLMAQELENRGIPG